MKLEYEEGIKRLLKEYSNLVREEIKKGCRWRQKIESGRLSVTEQETLLKEICGQLLVQGRGAKSVRTQINRIEKVIGKWSIENIERNLDAIGMLNKKIQKLNRILQYLKNNTISDWVMRLHHGDNGIPCMGLKSDDDFLKTHSFYEHVPVDRHTQRFLFRTGIVYWYLKKNDDDILTLFGGEYEKKYKLFQKIIVEFCKVIGQSINIPSSYGKLNLAKNPGILDIVIWRHCGEDEKLGCKNICGNRPKCNKCILREICLWYILR